LKQKYFILNLLFALVACPAAFAQGEANIWYFGNQAGLDFSGGNPVAVFNGQLSAVEGVTTIADSQGDLQFYTNGITVWNKFHVPMANGTGLFGDFSSTQAAVVVQKPGSVNLYYVFTTNPFETDGGLRYSIVDMSANNGLGQVTAKNILLNGSTCEKISVVRHANGQDVWVVTHLWNSDAFYALKVTSAGIGTTQVTSNAGSIVTADSDHANAVGYMKVSADGKKIVTCHTFLNKAELFDFDTATGQVSNAQLLCDEANVYGVEFSPDNNILYISTVEQKKIFQFNLTASNIADSKILIATLPQSPGALQLAPNGKIYIAMAETDKLSVINNPDKTGVNCNLTVNSIDLEGRVCMLGLPSFNQSFLYTKVSADNLCTGSNTGFAFEAGFTPTGLSWNFGDASAVSTQNNPSHHYVNAGTYNVTVTAYYPGGSISRTKEIAVTQAPVATQIGTQTFCIDASQVYSLSSNDAALLNGQSPEDYSINYFATAADAENLTNPLADNYILTAGPVTIYANIKSLSTGGCSAIVHFTLTAFEKPTTDLIEDLTVCDGLIRDDRAEFDLDAKADEILAGQQAGTSVKFYTSESDAESAHSPVSGLYTNETDGQSLYARIQNGGGCYKIVAFNLVVAKCNDSADFDIFPKFFTPNGDGYNDSWKTKASIGTPSFKIEIFDRFGRLLKTFTETDNEWNGTYAGKDLPSDDYWFVLSGENITEYRGHFSLKR
jgi:gliding motility-associated-like protein